MTHQKRAIIILGAVLAGLLLLIFLIPILTAPKEAEEQGDTVEKTYLCPIDAAQVERISYTKDGFTTVLIRTDGIWYTEDGSSVNQDVVGNMLSAITGLYSTQLAATGADAFAAAGLDAPTLNVTAMAGKESIAIHVGNYNNGLDRWYCSIGEEEQVWLIGNNLCNRFSADLFME